MEGFSMKIIREKEAKPPKQNKIPLTKEEKEEEKRFKETNKKLKSEGKKTTRRQSEDRSQK